MNERKGRERQFWDKKGEAQNFNARGFRNSALH